MLKKILVASFSIILIFASIACFVNAAENEFDDDLSIPSGDSDRGARLQPSANFTYLIADGTNFIGSTAFRVDDGNLDIFIEAFPATGTDWDPASVTKADLIIQEYHGHVTHYDADTVAMVVNNTGAHVVGNAQVRSDMLARNIPSNQVTALSPTVGNSVSQTVLGVKITSYGMMHTGFNVQVDTYLVELPNGIKFFHGTCASAASAANYMAGFPELYGLNVMILDYEHDFTAIDNTFYPEVMAKVHDFNNNGLGTLWDDYPQNPLTLLHNTTYNYVLPEYQPELSEELLDPTTGDNETDYEYSVKYKYLPNAPPTKSQIVIDDIGYDMNTQAGSGWDVGVEYTYNTKLSGGSHEYHFEFEVDSKSVRLPVTGEFSGPEVNSLPMLSGEGFTPDKGDTETDFTFSIVYTDGDNDIPSQKKLILDGHIYAMSSLDTTFTDGAIYTYETTLEIGAHSYYYTFNDGNVDVRYPASGDLDGPEIVRANDAPLLTLWEVTPSSGNKDDKYTFSIKYTDADDDAPTSAEILVDGKEYAMTASSSTYIGGVIFTYSTYLDRGPHYYHFEFNDSRVEVRAPADISQEFDGPMVINRAPIAAIDEPLDGDTFNTDQVIKFDATSSSDPDGDPITIEFHSNLDGQLGTDKIIETSLSEGEHTITLTVSDNFNAITSKTLNITVIQLKPNLSNIDITLTPEEPEEGQTVTVKVTISNTGNAPANDVEVTISIDDSSLSEDTISKIEASSTKSTETAITATAGTHLLKVEILDGLEKTLEFTVEERIRPTAVAGEDVTVNVQEQVSFDGSQSSTPGTILTYFWEFDDGSNKTGRKVQHTYANKGTYNVKLTVTDDLGKKDTDTVTVTVLASESTTSKDSGMDLTYVGIIIVIIIIIVFLVLFLMLKRKKRSGQEGELTGQVAPPFPPPTVPQQQMSYIPPPEGFNAQPQLEYITPPQDIATQPQQPQLGYIQPPQFETTPQPQMGYIQPPQYETAPQPQMEYAPPPQLEAAPQPQLGYLQPSQEDAAQESLESPEVFLPQEDTIPPSQENIETQPPQDNVTQPTVKTPKIVPKIKQNNQ